MGRARVIITKTMKWAVEVDNVEGFSEATLAASEAVEGDPYHEMFTSDIVSLDGLGYDFDSDYLSHQEKEGEHKRLLILRAKGSNVKITQEHWDIFIQSIKDSGVHIIDQWNGAESNSGSVRYSGSDPYITPEQVAQIQEAIKDLQPEIMREDETKQWEISFKSQQDSG